MSRIKLLVISAIFIFTIVVVGCTPTPVNYQLSTSHTPSNGGTVSPSGGTFEKGKDVTLVATPANYYKFNGWAGDVSGTTDRITIKMDSSKNIVASFTKIMYSLQLIVNPLGGGTLDPSNGNYEAGNQVKITATPATGYRFDHWGGSATGTANQISILMDNNKTVTAYFTRQYTLRVASNPSDGGTVNVGNGLYDAGTQVKLSATQVFPYAFNGWTSTDNDNANPTIVTLSTDKSVIANFVKIPPPSWQEAKGIVYRGGTTSVPIELDQYTYVEGEIIQSTFSIYIQDPIGNTIKNFGYIQQGNFLITAQVPGRYTIVLQKDGNSSGVSGDFVIRYRIYKK